MIRTALTVLVILCALALSSVPVSAKPICEGGEEIWNDIMLYGFKVNSDQPINVGDVVYYDFYIKNIGSERIKIGKGGIYLKTSLGDKYSFYAGEILDPGKSAHISSSFRVSEAGEMRVNPGICVSAEGGDVCHDFETSCSFEVFIECPEGTICMTPEQASQGNYIRVSDEICGYECLMIRPGPLVRPGPPHIEKVPMYCYREVFECPETCQCLPQSEAEKNGMVPCGGLSELKFCGYKDGEEMYCYQRDLPDLRISDVWPYPTSDAYTRIRASVYNYGGYAGNSTVAFFVDGEKVGEVEIKGLKHYEYVVAELQLPNTRICSGTEDVFEAIADYHKEINESDENNNRCSRVYECAGAELPDLEVIDVWHEGEENYTCTIREYTDENRIWFAVKNSGNSASPSAQIRLYIDGDWWATTTIPPLNPNEEYKGNFSYYIGVCSHESDIIKIIIDPQNNIPEIDDRNNELEEVWNCIVTPKEKPDLIIRRAALIPLPDYEYQIEYEIRNQGQGYACGSHTGLYVDDVLVATDYVDRLAPGESVEKTFWWNYSMRECTPPSDTIRVVADYRNEIEEISEDNNEYSLSFECMEVPTQIVKPDLTVEDIWIEGNGVSDLTIVFRIRNIGSAESDSTVSSVNVNYRNIGTVNVPPLDAGESVDLRLEHWTPQWNDNRIEICVDSGNYIDEVPYEENNCLVENFHFELSCSDGVRNRDEVGIDCGGRYCPPCGFVEVKGRILYEDDDGSFKPARFLKFRIKGDINWGPFLTDSDGNFSIPFSQNLAGSKFYIYIDAWDINYAARIARDLDGCNEYVWFESTEIEVPSRGILNLGDLRIGKDRTYGYPYFVGYWQEKVHTCLFGSCVCGGDIHGFAGGSVYLNIADAILTARTYADAHRDDDDGIGRVDVQYPDDDWSNYDPYWWDEITLYKGPDGDHGFEDGTVIHEYAHFLQDKISEEEIYIGSMHHRFCSVKDTEFAFMEGFAEYFGTFIVAINPHLNPPNIDYTTIENPYSECSRLDEDVEGAVAAVLWDMADNSSFSGSINEQFDDVEGLDGIIFMMLDKELDHWYDAPDLCEMHSKLNQRVDPDTYRKIDEIFRHYNCCR